MSPGKAVSHLHVGGLPVRTFVRGQLRWEFSFYSTVPPAECGRKASKQNTLTFLSFAKSRDIITLTSPTSEPASETSSNIRNDRSAGRPVRILLILITSSMRKSWKVKIYGRRESGKHTNSIWLSVFNYLLIVYLTTLLSSSDYMASNERKKQCERKQSWPNLRYGISWRERINHREGLSE
jgi:hypothetical protein